MTSVVVVKRSISGWQDNKAHVSPGGGVVQHSGFRITVSMDEYVKSKLRPIEVPRGYLSNTKEISDGMLTNVK